MNHLEPVANKQAGKTSRKKQESTGRPGSINIPIYREIEYINVPLRPDPQQAAKPKAT